MANICENYLYADPQVIRDIQKDYPDFEFEDIVPLESDGPDQMEAWGSVRYRSSVEWDDGEIVFETKWSPALGIVKHLSAQFDTRIVTTYVELGMGLCGISVFDSGNTVVDDCDLYPDVEDFVNNDEYEKMYYFLSEEARKHL